MHFVRITDDSNRADIAEAVTHLWHKRKHDPDEWVREALTEDIDDLLELWVTAAN